MTIECKYKLGDLVVLKTDREKRERIVIGIDLRPDSISYVLACGDQTTNHYGCEIEKMTEKKIGFQ